MPMAHVSGPKGLSIGVIAGICFVLFCVHWLHRCDSGLLRVAIARAVLNCEFVGCNAPLHFYFYGPRVHSCVQDRRHAKTKTCSC